MAHRRVLASLTRLSRILGVAAVLSLAPVAATAEWQAGFYLGASKTRDFSAGAGTSAAGGQNTIEGKTSAGFGLRLGYWFESVSWLGLAGDLGGFGVAKDLRVLSGSLLLMARPPLSPGQGFPRLQPYVGLGVARYESLLKVGETPCPLCAFGPTAPVEEESYYEGPDYRAGLTWWFGKNWGLLGEYRYTRIKASFPSLPGPLTFKTHHGNLGLLYRWDR